MRKHLLLRVSYSIDIVGAKRFFFLLVWLAPSTVVHETTSEEPREGTNNTPSHAKRLEKELLRLQTTTQHPPCKRRTRYLVCFWINLHTRWSIYLLTTIYLVGPGTTQGSHYDIPGTLFLRTGRTCATGVSHSSREVCSDCPLDSEIPNQFGISRLVMRTDEMVKGEK